MEKLNHEEIVAYETEKIQYSLDGLPMLASVGKM